MKLSSSLLSVSTVGGYVVEAFPFLVYPQSPYNLSINDDVRYYYMIESSSMSSSQRTTRIKRRNSSKNNNDNYYYYYSRNKYSLFSRNDDNQEEQESETTTNTNNYNPTSQSSSSSSSITLQPVGKLSSVYRLCVGTPRQGLLAPNSRGRIDIYPNQLSYDCIQDLDQYSHIWIVFIFHLNSNSHVIQNRLNEDEDTTTAKKKKKEQQFPSKIAPPALGGKKRVGIFSTRTPHRPNPIGFTLCKVDSIHIPSKKKAIHVGAKVEPCSIHVSGLDLVDGTPVLDIKPYIPHFDSVGYSSSSSSSSSSSVLFETNEEGGEVRGNNNSMSNSSNNGGRHDDNNNHKIEKVRVPDWVSEGLTKRRTVTFSTQAEQELQTIMERNNENDVPIMKFYGVSSGRDESLETSITSLKACIVEVLGVDVRSTWQTRKVRRGKFQAERSHRVKEVIDNGVIITQSSRVIDNKAQNGNEVGVNNMCTQQLDNLLIKYTVNELEKGGEGESGNEGGAVNTDGSGADDAVTVQSIEPIISAV